MGNLRITADGLPIHTEHNRLSVVGDLYCAWCHWLGNHFARAAFELIADQPQSHPITGRGDLIFIREELIWIQKPIELRPGHDTNRFRGWLSGQCDEG